MPAVAPLSSAIDVAALESSILGVLLNAESARDGAAFLIPVLASVFDDQPCALAARDRDGLTLHLLADHGTPIRWPERLEPQLALGAQAGVDADTGTMVVPLRANGRVAGMLLVADPQRARHVLASSQVQSILETAAAVLHVLLARMDGELRRRAMSLRSLDTVIDAMAHQISNPLTGASAIAQLLDAELQDEGQRAAVAQIRLELSRAFGVLRDVLDFQRDTGAQDGVLDLSAVVQRLTRFRGYAIREQGIALEIELNAAFLPVRAELRALEHALLLALRFAECRSHGNVNRRIAVRVVELSSSEVAVCVTDSGAGELPQLIPQYFDLPFRAEQQRDEQADLGLVGSILRGCGGRLEVDGSKADGTTLSLILPRANTHSSTATRTIV